MINLYNTNDLIFWNKAKIRKRNFMKEVFALIKKMFF